MYDPACLLEVYQNDLMQLHNHLMWLEKLEIRRTRHDISDEDLVNTCRKRIGGSQDMIAIIQERSVVCLSSGAGKLLGYSPEEMIGSVVSKYIHPDELPKVVEYNEKRMSGQDAPIIYETVLVHKNQSNIYVKMIASRFVYLGRPAIYVIIKVLAQTI